MQRFKELENTLNAIDRLKRPGRIIVIAFRNSNKPAHKQVSVDVVGPGGENHQVGKTSVANATIEASVTGETLAEALEAAAGDLDPRDPTRYKGRHILTEGASPATLIQSSGLSTKGSTGQMETLRDLRNTLLIGVREAGSAGDYAKAAALRQKSVGVNLAIKALT